MGWNNDMDAAPRDGTGVLLAPHMVTAGWDFGAEDWLVMNIPLNEDRTISGDWNVRPKMWFELMATIAGVQPTHWWDFGDGKSMPDAPT